MTQSEKLTRNYSVRSIQLIAGALGRAGEAGRKLRLERAENGAIDFDTNHSLVLPQDMPVEVVDGEDVLELGTRSMIHNRTVTFATERKKWEARKREEAAMASPPEMAP
jgi:hypothetical protein